MLVKILLDVKGIKSFQIEIVGTLGPGVHYLFIYWTRGPS